MIRTLSIAGFIFALMTGCDGGNSDHARYVDPAMAYTGTASQATVTKENALELSLKSENGSIVATQIINRVRDEIENIEQMEIKKDVQARTMKRTAEYEDTDGNGGTVFCRIEFNDSTGHFAGTLEYRGFRKFYDLILDGTIDIAGSFSSNTISRLSISFNPLTTEYYDSNEISLTGMISLDMDNSSDDDLQKITANISLFDYSENKTYWYSNYKITHGYDVYFAHSISGRFYHPDAGYVDITTPIAYAYGNCLYGPGCREIICSGIEQTWVNNIITFGSRDDWTKPTSFWIYFEADTDGDGNTDWKNDQGYFLM